VRTLISFVGIVAVFGAAVMYGGRLVGAWDAVAPSQPPAAAPAKPAATTTREEPEPATTAAVTTTATPADQSTPEELEWQAKAAEVCRRAIEEGAALPQPRNEKEALVVLAQAIDLNAFYNDEFTGLGPPPGKDAEFARLGELLATEERILNRMLETMRAGNRGFLEVLVERLTRTALEEDDVLFQLGATGCSTTLPQLYGY
jgi:hypothetical protein